MCFTCQSFHPLCCIDSKKLLSLVSGRNPSRTETRTSGFSLQLLPPATKPVIHLQRVMKSRDLSVTANGAISAVIGSFYCFLFPETITQCAVKDVCSDLRSSVPRIMNISPGNTLSASAITYKVPSQIISPRSLA